MGRRKFKASRNSHWHSSCQRPDPRPPSQEQNHFSDIDDGELSGTLASKGGEHTLPVVSLKVKRLESDIRTTKQSMEQLKHAISLEEAKLENLHIQLGGAKALVRRHPSLIHFRKPNNILTLKQEEQLKLSPPFSVEDEKQPAFLRSLYEKKILSNGSHPVTTHSQAWGNARRNNFERRMAFVRWIPDPRKFNVDTLEAQVTNPSDLIPDWSDWVFNSNIPIPESEEERIPDSLAEKKDWERQESQTGNFRRITLSKDHPDAGDRVLPELE